MLPSKPVYELSLDEFFVKHIDISQGALAGISLLSGQNE
jgi:hypothetical protein